MESNVFVVSFDATDPRLEIKALETFVKGTPEIQAWWNHIPGVFMLQTTFSPRELGIRLKEVAGEVRFLASRADLAEMAGYLPESSWAWINRRQPVAAGSSAPAETASQ